MTPRWSPRRTGITVTMIALAVGVPVLVVARTSNDQPSGRSIGQLLLFGVVLALLIVAVARIAALLAGVDPDAQLIANRLATGPDERRLLARWLRRTRWARNVGGYAGIVWWVLGTSLQGDLLLYGVGGVALGSMAAQLHHVRRIPGPRTASLESRAVGGYLPSGDRRRMVGTVAAAAVLVVGGLALTDARGASAWALAALAVVGAGSAVQRRVASRPRPALTTGLQRADDLARRLAIGRGLARPASYCALALIAHGARDLEPSLGPWALVISIGAWGYAVWSWWQNRRLGLDHLIDRPLPAA